MRPSTESPAPDLKPGLKKPLQWFFLAGLASAIATAFLPNHYRSVARLLPVDTKGISGALGGLAGAAAAFGVNVSGSEGSDANFVDVLNSRWLREQLLRTEFQYHVRSWRFGTDRLAKETLYGYIDKDNIDQALKKLESILSASRDLKTRVVSISAETKSPELSQLVVGRAVRLLEAFQQDKGRTRGGAKVIYTQARLAEARQEMDRAEDVFRRFLEDNRNYISSSDPTVRLRGGRLEAELRLRQQLVTTLAMNCEQALLEEKNDVPILNVMDPANLPIEKSKPHRSLLVLLASLLAGLGCWAWLNRVWIQGRWLSNADEPRTAVEEQIG